jgi:hypothetical protein
LLHFFFTGNFFSNGKGIKRRDEADTALSLVFTPNDLLFHFGAFL